MVKYTQLINTYFYYFNSSEKKIKLMNLKNDYIYFPNIYEIWNKNNSTLEIQLKLYNSIKNLEEELKFIAEAENYMKKQCIFFTNETLESDTYYSSSEFINYMSNLCKLYHVEYLTDFDSFFLNSFLFNDVIGIFNKFKLRKENTYAVEKRVVSNTYYLNLFISNLKYILDRRVVTKTKDLITEETKFMIFLYNFDYYFLNILFHRYFLYYTNILNPLNDDSFSLRLVNINYLLADLSIDATLKDFEEIFEVDLFSEFINYKNDLIKDYSNPLLNHILFLYNSYKENVLTVKSHDFNTFNRTVVEANNNCNILVDSEKLTLGYLEKVIKGICFLNRYTNFYDWCNVEPFSYVFNKQMEKLDTRYNTFELIIKDEIDNFLSPRNE